MALRAGLAAVADVALASVADLALELRPLVGALGATGLGPRRLAVDLAAGLAAVLAAGLAAGLAAVLRPVCRVAIRYSRWLKSPRRRCRRWLAGCRWPCRW